MPNNQSPNSNSTAGLDPKTRQAINRHLCEPNAAKILTDAGRASQQARNVGGQKPVRKPVVTNGNNGKTK
ncbi:MAG: hypothetical protein Q9171_005853 [Xanthocarpia ochracea]